MERRTQQCAPTYNDHLLRSATLLKCFSSPYFYTQLAPMLRNSNTPTVPFSLAIISLALFTAFSNTVRKSAKAMRMVVIGVLGDMLRYPKRLVYGDRSLEMLRPRMPETVRKFVEKYTRDHCETDLADDSDV